MFVPWLKKNGHQENPLTTRSFSKQQNHFQQTATSSFGKNKFQQDFGESDTVVVAELQQTREQGFSKTVSAKAADVQARVGELANASIRRKNMPWVFWQEFVEHHDSINSTIVCMTKDDVLILFYES
jgi:hypothetical protein